MQVMFKEFEAKAKEITYYYEFTECVLNLKLKNQSILDNCFHNYEYCE